MGEHGRLRACVEDAIPLPRPTPHWKKSVQQSLRKWQLPLSPSITPIAFHICTFFLPVPQIMLVTSAGAMGVSIVAEPGRASPLQAPSKVLAARLGVCCSPSPQLVGLPPYVCPSYDFPATGASYCDLLDVCSLRWKPEKDERYLWQTALLVGAVLSYIIQFSTLSDTLGVTAFTITPRGSIWESHRMDADDPHSQRKSPLSDTLATLLMNDARLWLSRDRVIFESEDSELGSGSTVASAFTGEAAVNRAQRHPCDFINERLLALTKVKAAVSHERDWCTTLEQPKRVETATAADLLKDINGLRDKRGEIGDSDLVKRAETRHSIMTNILTYLELCKNRDPRDFKFLLPIAANNVVDEFKIMTSLKKDRAPSLHLYASTVGALSGVRQAQVLGIVNPVPRSRIEASYRRVHGPTTNTFNRQRIPRRKYNVKGYNSLIHHDGQHGMIRYKIVVHGFIDGFSRFILGIKASNNNRAQTVYDLFLDFIRIMLVTSAGAMGVSIVASAVLINQDQDMEQSKVNQGVPRLSKHRRRS
ncbi:hypothetical protein NMY22_g16756 [Coprinellus aureogranulatus]|nr:hypothetical protein NMY22_g16756 [Coprinellus aureogranulatus]